MNFRRQILLQGAHNVRDLGGYPTACGNTTRWGTILRADALHELSPSDVDTLIGLRLRTVIDLRSDAELAREPSVFADHAGVRYHHIPIFDGLDPVEAMAAANGGPFELAIRYREAIDRCRPAIVTALLAVADAEDGVVLFNCTAGKDRTGIIAAILLGLAGVSTDDIAADYALTGTLSGGLMTRLRDRAAARGLDPSVATVLLSSEAETMLALLRHLDERHGGVAAYLAAGVEDAALVERLSRRLIDTNAA
jgi:protein-tyrosine phosphatase